MLPKLPKPITILYPSIWPTHVTSFHHARFGPATVEDNIKYLYEDTNPVLRYTLNYELEFIGTYLAIIDHWHEALEQLAQWCHTALEPLLVLEIYQEDQKRAIYRVHG